MENSGALNILISANFTIKPIENIVNYWAGKSGKNFQVSFSEPLQIIQPLISFKESKNHYHLIFLRLEDCYVGVALEDKQQRLGDFLDDFKKALIFATAEKREEVIVIDCPRSIVLDASSNQLDLEIWRNDLSQFLLALHTAHYISEKDLFSLYPMDRYEDHFSYKAAMIPYIRECYTALGTIAFRKVAALSRNPYKVIVLDCDNTLWKGVVAEDGVSSLSLDDNYLGLQQFFVDLQSKGFLLCLCSKNIEQDVWSVFEYFREVMPLKKEHIISWKINWQMKSANLQALSEELNLGLDSFIFLDDNPVEVNEVKTFLPQVACFQVPDVADEIPMFLKHIWLFDVAKIGHADRNRTIYYQQDKERKLALEAYCNYEGFIEALNIQLEIIDLTEDQIDRASQMTMRTNQFNFSGIKYSQNEVRKIFLGGSSKCLLVTAKDRYGDYGIIASIFYAIDAVSLRLDNFLLSCRALGKRIEYLIWDKVCDIARKHQISVIKISFCVSERNEPAQKFLKSINVEFSDKDSPEILHYSLG